MNDEKNIIFDPQKRFMEINMKEVWGICGDQWYFNKGEIRERLASIYKSGETYTFLRISTNLEAVNEMDKYVAVKKDGQDDSHYKVREKRTTDKPDRYPACPNLCIPVSFNKAVMDDYLFALETLVKSNVGEKSYTTFPLVHKGRETGGVHQPWEELLWSIIYVMRRKENSELFGKIVNDLHNKETYGIICKKEAPQNYHMREIDLLRKLDINPFTFWDHEWKVNSETLKHAVDFLVPFHLSIERRSGSWLDD